MSQQFYARAAKPGDEPLMLQMEQAAWAGIADDYTYTLEQFQDAVRVFPAGQILVIDSQSNALAAMFNTVRIHYNPNDQLSWPIVSGDGWASRSHNLNGEHLYGVNLGCHPFYRGRGAGRLAIETALKLTVQLELNAFYAAGRLPDYHRFNEIFSPEHYVHLRMSPEGLHLVTPNGETRNFDFRRVVDAIQRGQRLHPYDGSGPTTAREAIGTILKYPPLDRGLRPWSRARHLGRPLAVVGHIPNYMIDAESLDNGALMYWQNPEKIE